MKKAAFFYGVTAVLFYALSAAAAERVETLDQNKDGFKETKVIYDGAKKVRAEVDRDRDGKTDQWTWFGADGKVVREAWDTNGDGKQDKFYLFLKGRNLVLHEYDRNGDGKIDERAETFWDANKKIPSGVESGRVTYLYNPGYSTLWREKDTNFDGIIDQAMDRNDKAAAAKKVGQKMNTQVTDILPTPEEAPTKPKGPVESPTERLVREKNSVFDYNR